MQTHPQTDNTENNITSLRYAGGKSQPLQGLRD